MLLFLFIAIGIGLYFLFRSHPVVPPEAFFLPDSDGFVVVRIDPGDEGHVAFWGALAGIERLTAEPAGRDGDLPEARAQDVPERLERIAPLNFVAVLYHLESPQEIATRDFELPETDDELSAHMERWLEKRAEKKRFNKGLAVSMRRGGLAWLTARMFIAEMVRHDGSETRHRDVRIGVSPAGNVLGHLKNNIMLADREQIVHEWIDVLKDSDPAAGVRYNGPPDLENTYERLDRSAPLYFAVSNRKGELRSLLESFLEMHDARGENGHNGEELPERVEFITERTDEIDAITAHVRALGGSFSITDPDRGELDVYAECEDEPSAQEIAGVLEEIFRHLTDDDVVLEVKADGDVAHVRLIYHDLPARITD